MRVNEIMASDNNSEDLQFKFLSKHCHQFIDESGGFPILKNLPNTFSDIHKVKVRRRKQKSQMTESFNRAFKNQYNDLRERALYVYGSCSPITLAEDQELFYIFPIDGYKFMYNTAVVDSGQEYKNAFETMLEKFENDERASQIITDLLQYTYTSTDLSEGLQQAVEIIMYNLPYYYAVREQAVEDYAELLTLID